LCRTVKVSPVCVPVESAASPAIERQRIAAQRRRRHPPAPRTRYRSVPDEDLMWLRGPPRRGRRRVPLRPPSPHPQSPSLPGRPPPRALPGSPSGAAVGAGSLMMVPSPPHCGHPVTVETRPKAVMRTWRTCPLPPHVGHGWAPARDVLPVPWQVSQVRRRSTGMRFSTPSETSSSVISRS
jgi:hypothetical protein